MSPSSSSSSCALLLLTSSSCFGCCCCCAVASACCCCCCCSCSCCAAPFLWLRLAGALGAGVVAAVPAFVFDAVFAALRAFRERGAGVSGNVPSAGVEGLLARPLLVVVTVEVVVVVPVVVIGVGVFATSAFCASASVGFAVLPLLALAPPALFALAAGGGATPDDDASSLAAGSVLIGTVGSFVGFVSVDLAPLGVAAKSGTAVVIPFGLLDADEAGRCRLWSAVDCIELPLALEDAGRAEAVEGAGELRTEFLGSASFG